MRKKPMPTGPVAHIPLSQQAIAALDSLPLSKDRVRRRIYLRAGLEEALLAMADYFNTGTTGMPLKFQFDLFPFCSRSDDVRAAAEEAGKIVEFDPPGLHQPRFWTGGAE